MSHPNPPMEKSLLGTVGRPRSSCLKCIADKKKCLPLLQPGGKYSSCQRCHAKLILCSFGEMNSEINSEKNVEVSSKAPEEEELSKKPRYISCSTAQPSVLTEKRRRIMESCNGVGEADVSGRATHLPSFSLGCVDELNHEEADRCGPATPLPSQFHSAEDAFNVCDDQKMWMQKGVAVLFLCPLILFLWNISATSPSIQNSSLFFMLRPHARVVECYSSMTWAHQ